MSHTFSNQATLLTELFDLWNQEEIGYLVLRNYEELPAFTGNDIDILIDPQELDRAQDLLRGLAKGKSWGVHNIGEFACRAVYLFHEETLEQVHIDLICGIKWHALLLMGHQQMLQQRQSYNNFYVPAPAHEAALDLIYRLVYSGHVKEKYKDKIREEASGDRRAMVDVLNDWIGQGMADRVVELAARGEWKRIEDSCFEIRKNVLRTNLRKPRSLVFSLWKDVLRLVRRLVHPPGISIVFFGPDGCGKTSVAERLQIALQKSFSLEKGMRCHWKPIRPKGGSVAPVVDPHGRPLRSWLMSRIYFIYHYLPFIWGWWIYVKPVLFKNGLIILDRYYYDFFVDLHRYRLNLPQWIVKLGFLFVQKPDLVFCLDAEPEILQARKKEVLFEECHRQRETYRALAKKLPNGHVINASQPLESVVRDVQAIILGFMNKRTAKRCFPL